MLYLAQCRHCAHWINSKDLANFKSNMQSHLEKSHRHRLIDFPNRLALDDFKVDFGIITERDPERIAIFDQSWRDGSFFEVLLKTRRKRESEIDEHIMERGRFLAGELIMKMQQALCKPARPHTSKDETEKENASLARKNLRQVDKNDLASKYGKGHVPPSRISIKDEF